MAAMGILEPPGRAVMIMAALLGAWLLPGPRAEAGQIESSAYFHLRRGMSESEVLVRAGAPDLVTSPGLEAVEVKRGMVDRGVDGEMSFDTFRRTYIPTIAQWHYVPGPEETDPFITIITFRGGEIWEIERTKVFSRHRSEVSASPSERQVSDAEIRRERADNTLKAAEAYAATRARLKEQAGQAGEQAGDDSATGRSKTIYRSVQPDGSTYFGDAPPGESSRVIAVD